jgi:hypothetical protein
VKKSHQLKKYFSSLKIFSFSNNFFVFYIMHMLKLSFETRSLFFFCDVCRPRLLMTPFLYVRCEMRSLFFIFLHANCDSREIIFQSSSLCSLLHPKVANLAFRDFFILSPNTKQAFLFSILNIFNATSIINMLLTLYN